MRHTITGLLSGFSVGILFTSCSQQQAPQESPSPRAPVYVGKVDRVYPQHKYVLIALAGNVYEPGTVLISQSDGKNDVRRVANLMVSDERMGRTRIPADIRSGSVEVGDLVFLYRNLAAPDSTNNPVTLKKDVEESDTETTPDSGAEGLLPLPGESSTSDWADPAAPGKTMSDEEREKIMNDLDTVPEKTDDP